MSVTAIVVKALTGILLKAVATLGSKVLLEYVIFKALEVAVKHTETEHDDEFFEKFKKEYKAKE